MVVFAVLRRWRFGGMGQEVKTCIVAVSDGDELVRVYIMMYRRARART